jgi:hypothetical protein
MNPKDYIIFNNAIKAAREYALAYYGGNKEDANDMLMGIDFVAQHFNKLIKQS